MTYTVVPDIQPDLERLNWSIAEAKGSKMIFLGDLIDIDSLSVLYDQTPVIRSTFSRSFASAKVGISIKKTISKYLIFVLISIYATLSVLNFWK